MSAVLESTAAQLVCTVRQGAEAMGYVVIDSTVGGASCGGLRLLPDVDEAEMRGLARAMTLKYGFLGLPQGGAKAGVRGDPEAPLVERRQRLAEFARTIEPLLASGTYQPGPDMGTDNADIRHALAAVGVPVKHRALRGGHSGYHTALTVLAGAREACKLLGRSLAGCTVAIEGFGKVGGPLAALLQGAGARVVAISTSRGALYNPRGLDVARLTALATETGSRAVELDGDAERLDCAALPELPVELLCPCARHDSVHAGNASRIAARIICPGANNPVTPDAERILFDRGVLCLPDFVTNSGGVLGSTMEFASVSQAQIAWFIEQRIGPRIGLLLDEAARQRVPPRDVAEPLALRRHVQLQRSAQRPGPRGRLFGLGLELYRQGWLPGALVGRLSLPYFARVLA